TRRVLRPGGRCLLSFFVLDHYRGPGTTVWSGYEFNHPLAGEEGVAVYSAAMPEQLIAYGTERIGRLAADASLAVRRVVSGLSSRSQAWCVNEQDLVLLEAV